MINRKAVKRELVLYDLGFPLADSTKEYYEFLKYIIDNSDVVNRLNYGFIIHASKTIKEKYGFRYNLVEYDKLISGKYQLDIKCLCYVFFQQYDLHIFEYSKKEQYVYMIILPIIEHLMNINVGNNHVLWYGKF